VLLDCRAGKARGLLRAAPKVRADDELLARLAALPGVTQAEFRYDPPPVRGPLPSAPAAPTRAAPHADAFSGAFADSTAD
jgi:hypothetical protein